MESVAATVNTPISIAILPIKERERVPEAFVAPTAISE